MTARPNRCLRGCATLLLAASGAFAPVLAADRLLLPLAPVLEHAETRRMLGDVQVRFGIRTPAAAGEELRASSWGRPHDARGYHGTVQVPTLSDGRAVPLTRQQVCELALRYTLAELVAEARKRGARGVVDIVSHNDEGAETNSATQFECVPGSFSSSVNLRGRAAQAGEL